MSQTTKTLLGALVAAALAIAAYYGLINQQQAANIQNQANQTLGTGPAAQQQPTAGTPAASNAATTATPPTAPAPTTGNGAPVPQH